MEISGKTVFISGGGGGIGGGMAQAFAEKGARIVLADISTDFAQGEAANLPDGTEVLVLSLDVTSAESWASAKAAAIARFGQVDVLCNNAGIANSFKPLVEVPPEEFARVMAVNVTGVYNGVRAFGPDFIARGAGHIVNTSSLNGLIPFTTFATYTASKFAVLGLSDALRMEMAPRGVGVSTLFPGLTRSRMSEAQLGTTEQARARMMDPVWLGRAVVRAVEENQPYIITHPDHRAAFIERCDALLSAFGEPAQPGYGAQT